ncbi:MAG: CHASE2 domain-containing protein, partial [Phormidesmis sp.]
MEKRVVLSLGHGSLQSGFPAVTAQLWEEGSRPMKFSGALPAAPEIASVYRAWQMLYRAMHHRLNWQPRMEIEAADVTNVSEVEFEDLCQGLALHINNWLNAADFRPIDQILRTYLDPQDDICLVVETDDSLLQQLPWHLWHFFDTYPQAEVALSPSSYQRASTGADQPSASRIRILVVLGSAEGIDVARDRTYLSALAQQAEVSVLAEPSLEALTQALWQGCDLFFFAGHSSSRVQGEIQLNADQSLTLEQLKYALRGAIARGLKLAIFNSCDGLGLARSLADLSIPQVIVMREPVPDRVAQAFLKQFLTAFVQDRSIYRSVRTAREQLQGLEADYPCASWLPAIYQNPAEAPTSWQQWQADRGYAAPPLVASRPPRRPLRTVALASLLVTGLIVGIRHLGWLQPGELRTFDLLMRLRPEERPDPRLLIVTVTEADFQLPEQAERKGSLSDLALERLLQKLEPMQPQAIGLDIYRDFPADPEQSGLADRLSRQDNLYVICKSSDPTTDAAGIAPPPEIPLPQQGFSDVVKDPDNVLRRHLLAMNPPAASPCASPYSLSAQLAFHYLDTKGIAAEYRPDGILQIGDVSVAPLQPARGSYQAVDTWGYQTLLNYRATPSAADIAPVVTLGEVLSDRLRAEQVKDRIVLIG